MRPIVVASALVLLAASASAILDGGLTIAIGGTAALAGGTGLATTGLGALGLGVLGVGALAVKAKLLGYKKGYYGGHHGGGYAHGYSYGGYGYRHRRSIAAEKEETLALTDAIDPDHCARKLICHLQQKTERDAEETLIVEVFGDSADDVARAKSCQLYSQSCIFDPEWLLALTKRVMRAEQ